MSAWPVVSGVNLNLLAGVMRNVCGIAYIEDLCAPADVRPDAPLPVKRIVGTGFLISGDLVVTARHVFDLLKGTLKVENSHIVLVFVDYSPDGGFRFQLSRGIGATVFLSPEPDHVSKAPHTDYAYMEMKQPLKDLDGVPKPAGLLPYEHRGETVYVGKPVIVPGYYAGDSILRDFNQVNRFGPVVLHGHIAAISPFGLIAFPTDLEYLIDITSAGGMSGAPVIEPDTGRVLAMVRGGVETKQRQPLDVAFALPIAQDFTNLALETLAKVKACEVSRL
jgi:hypothetical protein